MDVQGYDDIEDECFVQLRVEDHDYVTRRNLLGIHTPPKFASLQSEFQEFAIRYLAGGKEAWYTMQAAYTKSHQPALPELPGGAIIGFHDKDYVHNGGTKHWDYNAKYSGYDEIATYGDAFESNCLVQNLFHRFICFKTGAYFADFQWGSGHSKLVILFGTCDMADGIPKLLRDLEKEISLPLTVVHDATFVKSDADWRKVALSYTERSGCNKALMREGFIHDVGDSSIY
jgi:hypothetical protein